MGLRGGPAGEGNLISHVTLRRFGGGGIVTSQLSNEIEYAHVHMGATIGLDQAGIHADNLNAHTSSLCTEQHPHGCGKRWHHSWVHHIRDKCVRADDGSLNTSVHHNVIWHCGASVSVSSDGSLEADDLLRPVARVSGCGIMMKGDYHQIYANTIFGTIGQGDIVLDTRIGPPCSSSPAGGGCVRQNNHTLVFNSAAEAWCPATSVAGPPCSKPHGTPIKTTAALVTGLVLVNVSANKSIPKNVSDVAAALGLRDAARFDFRPRLPQSPLVAAGVQVPPFTNSEPVPAGSASIDCGAYQAHDEAAADGAAAATTAWVPGCTFRPECAP